MNLTSMLFALVFPFSFVVIMSFTFGLTRCLTSGLCVYLCFCWLSLFVSRLECLTFPISGTWVRPNSGVSAQQHANYYRNDN